MALTNNHLEQLDAVGLSPQDALDSFTYIPVEVPHYNLNEGAWDVPVSQLVDLWTVRYGSKWVDEAELDEFYKVTTQRLRPLNKLETHYLNGTNVYRIVE